MRKALPTEVFESTVMKPPTYVWIVTQNGNVLGVFDTVEKVIASVEKTYSSPTVTTESPGLTVWSNGIKAVQWRVKTSADHL